MIDLRRAAGALRRHHALVHQPPRLVAQLLDGAAGRVGGVLLQVAQQALHLLRRPLARPLQLRPPLRVHLVHGEQQRRQLALQALVVALRLQAAEVAHLGPQRRHLLVHLVQTHHGGVLLLRRVLLLGDAMVHPLATIKGLPKQAEETEGQREAKVGTRTVNGYHFIPFGYSE